MLKEAAEVSESMRDEVKQLQTRPLYWSRGEKRTLRTSALSVTHSSTHLVKYYGSYLSVCEVV